MIDSTTLINIELGVSAWILLEIIGLKTKVAVISQKLNDAIEFNQLSKMTNKVKKFAVLILLSLSVGGTMTGCKTVEKILLQPSAPIVTTNAASTLVTNAQWQPNPTIAAAINTGEAVAPYVPAPFGTIAAAFLALCSTGLGIYARNKNILATTTLEQSAKVNAMLTTIIAGVEAANDKQTKQAIEKMAIAADNSELINSRVQSVSAQFPVANVLPLSGISPA